MTYRVSFPVLQVLTICIGIALFSHPSLCDPPKDETEGPTRAPMMSYGTETDIVKEEGLTCLLNALNDISLTYSVSSETLNGLLNEGIDQSIDVNTLLLQYYHLKDDARGKIDKCRLNLEPARSRCSSVYHMIDQQLKCRQVALNSQQAPFVTLECPNGYQRNGCCRCSRICDSDGLIMDDNGMHSTDKTYCKLFFFP
jgi:hypothetical protein